MTEPRQITLQYLRPGKPTATYAERLIVDRPDVKVLLMDVAGTRDMWIGKVLVAEPGSTLTWFVFPGQWHDVGRFQLADGTFTGWYTNICTPVEMVGDRWTITDLFLDLWCPAKGAAAWQDEDEFEDAVRSGTLHIDLAGAARTKRARIEALLARKSWPPEICRAWAPPAPQ